MPRNLYLPPSKLRASLAALFMAVCFVPGPALCTEARWVTLGTAGGPAVQPDRAQIANALVIGKSVYLFDVGNGVRRQMARANLRDANVKAIFLSHHHVDHNADVGPVLISHYLESSEKLKIVGPELTDVLVNGLIQANEGTILASYQISGTPRSSLRDHVQTTVIPPKVDEPTLVYSDNLIKVEAINVEHYHLPPITPLERKPQAVAFRVSAGGRTFVYTGDTGKTDALLKISKNVDVLITEIVVPEAIKESIVKRMGIDPEKGEKITKSIVTNHLAPDFIGKLAADAGVGQVVLTHLVPSPEDSPDAEAYVHDIRKTYKGPVSIASDLANY